MRPLNLILIGAALVALLAGPSDAVERTRVGVTFRVSAPACVARYKNDLPAVTTAGADTVRRILGDLLPFLVFEPEAGQDFHVVLDLALLDPQSAGASVRDIVARLTLSGTHQAPRNCFAIVRDKSRSGEHLPSRWNDLLAEVGSCMRCWSIDALVEQAFQSVPIATVALYSPHPQGWVLPFTREELCMDRQTRLEIDAERDEGAGMQPFTLSTLSGFAYAPDSIADVQYCGRVFLIPEQPVSPLPLDPSGVPSAFRLDAIRVRKFQPLFQCGVVPAETLKCAR